MTLDNGSGAPAGGETKRARIAPCLQCGLPAACRGEGSGPFCCTGCALAWHVGASYSTGGTDKLLARVLLSAFLTMGVMVASLSLYGELVEGGDLAERASESARALNDLGRAAALLLTAPIVYLLGLPLVEAVVLSRRWLSTESLILCGTGAALVASVWHTFVGGVVWYESAALVLVLVSLGRWMDARARERSRKGLELLLPHGVPPATRLSDSGEEQVEAAALAVGDRVRVRPGESLPVDGLVLEGRAFLDQAALTGEAEPRPVRPGDRVLAGTSLVDGSLVVQAEAVGEGRLRQEIERVLAGALSQRGQHVELADRLARFLFPIVLSLALAAACLRGRDHGLAEGVRTGLAVVLISCPCALGIATPLAFWTALGTAWRRGILVRGADVLERLARVRRVFFDKTGTLTDGELALEHVLPRGDLQADELLALAASVEAGSEHPIARALRRAHSEREGARPLVPLEELTLLPGIGVRGLVGGRPLVLRRAEAEDRLLRPDEHTTVVVLEEEGRVLGELHLAGHPRPEAPALVARLKQAGLELLLLTGDRLQAAQPVAERLQIPMRASLLPHQKVAVLEAAGRQDSLYVGDGLNDAAALAAADVGIAVAGSSPRSVEVADITLLRAGIEDIAPLIELARSSVRAARVNLVWAFAYNTAGLWLAATGRLTPVFAALAMVASSATVVLLSLRASRTQSALLSEAASSAGERAARSLKPSEAGS